MIYTKEELLEIWKEIITYTPLEDNPLANLKTIDYRSGKLFCNTCGESIGQLVRVNNVWACAVCNKVVISTKYKPAFLYKITNDLLDYFSPLNSECFFNSEKLQGFVNFVELDKYPNEYTLFLSFIRRILMKEVGALGVLDFLSTAEKNINNANAKKV